MQAAQAAQTSDSDKYFNCVTSCSITFMEGLRTIIFQDGVCSCDTMMMAYTIFFNKWSSEVSSLSKNLSYSSWKNLSRRDVMNDVMNRVSSVLCGVLRSKHIHWGLNKGRLGQQVWCYTKSCMRVLRGPVGKPGAREAMLRGVLRDAARREMNAVKLAFLLSSRRCLPSEVAGKIVSMMKEQEV